MLLLIILISILATNLFLGFFIAHQMGYGPRNFQELRTGIYLRPLGSARAAAVGPSGPPRKVIDSLTELLTLQLPDSTALLEDSAALLEDSGLEHQENRIAGTVDDVALCQAIIGSVHTLYYATLVLDRARLVALERLPLLEEDPAGDVQTGGGINSHDAGEPQSLAIDDTEGHGESGESGKRPGDSQANAGGFDDLAAATVAQQSQAVAERLEGWRRHLKSIQPCQSLAWWDIFLRRWLQCHRAWEDCRQGIDGWRQVRQAEKAFRRDEQAGDREPTETSCLRRKAAGKREWREWRGWVGWWRRPRRLRDVCAWVQRQRQELVQQLFEDYVGLRRQQRILIRSVDSWLLRTFQSTAVQRVWAQRFGSQPCLTLFGTLGAETQPLGYLAYRCIASEWEDRTTGFLILLRADEAWVEEFWRGGVVQEALARHWDFRVQQCLAVSGSAVGQDAQQLFRVDEVTIVVWTNSQQSATATLALSLVEAIQSVRREVGGREIKRNCRAVLLPLSSRFSSEKTLRHWLPKLDSPDLPPWRSQASVVWTVKGRRWLPLMSSAAVADETGPLDLAAWYRAWLLGDPLAETRGTDPEQQKAPSTQERGSRTTVTEQTAVAVATGD